MIIGFVGYKSSGKTTAAKVLCEFGFTRDSFARPLKDALKHVFNIADGVMDDPACKENWPLMIGFTREAAQELICYFSSRDYPIPLSGWDAPFDYPSKSSGEKPLILRTPRELMQYVGTKYFRGKVSPKFWIKAMEKNLRDGAGLVVIDDVRFQDEADLIKRLGGKIIKVDRPGYLGDNHESEQADSIAVDETMPNDGSVEDLRASVIKRFKEYFI